MQRILVSVLFAALVAAVQGQSVTTNVVTYLDKDASILWRTITESQANIALDWPKGSASAVLTVKVGSDPAQSVVLDDPTTNSCFIVFAMPSEHAERRVVQLSISYRDSGDAELSSSSVRLGLVDGIGQGASIPVTLDGASGAWRRFENRGVVQIPPDATAVELDSVAVDCDIPGWHCLETSRGEHTLSLTTSAGTASATVVRIDGGLFIIVR